MGKSSAGYGNSNDGGGLRRSKRHINNNQKNAATDSPDAKRQDISQTPPQMLFGDTSEDSSASSSDEDYQSHPNDHKDSNSSLTKLKELGQAIDESTTVMAKMTVNTPRKKSASKSLTEKGSAKGNKPKNVTPSVQRTLFNLGFNKGDKGDNNQQGIHKRSSTISPVRKPPSIEGGDMPQQQGQDMEAKAHEAEESKSNQNDSADENNKVLDTSIKSTVNNVHNDKNQSGPQAVNNGMTTEIHQDKNSVESGQIAPSRKEGRMSNEDTGLIGAGNDIDQYGPVYDEVVQSLQLTTNDHGQDEDMDSDELNNMVSRSVIDHPSETTFSAVTEQMPAPTDDIEFPANDDNLAESPPKPKSRRRRKKQTKARNTYITTVHDDNIADDNSEDSRNTIDSNEVSYNLTAEEGRRQVPPRFVRYRIGILIDADDLIANTDADATEQITPNERFQTILKDLVAALQSLDSGSLLVSWKNSPTYKVLSTVNTEFPTKTEDIATFFEGYKSKLKEGVKKFFQFCVHSPLLSNSRLESELVEWGRVNSYTLYACNLQAETSKTIGWLAYSMPFTNTTFLKNLLKSVSGHEWGFKYSTFTNSDKQLEWKSRIKALEIMVPAEKEHAARALISNTFKQRPSNSTFKSVTECYIYVGNEREHKEESMATIFLELVGRHRFQLTYINFVPVTVLIKSIDNKIMLRDGITQLSIREMILNLPSRDTRYGEQKLFQSVDFVPDPTKIWFNKVKGQGAACFYLTYYKWAEGEAVHTAEGLAAYLGKHYGRRGIYSSFTSDHWEYVKTWKWNRLTKKYDTPQEMNLAENVMFDPTATLMRAVQNHADTDTINNGTDIADDFQQLETVDGDQANENLNELQTAGDSTEPEEYVYDVTTATEALSIARSIQSASSMSGSNTNSQSTSLTRLAAQRATELGQAQIDDEMNSLGNADNGVSNVGQVFHNDNVSITSDMTDITDNTVNNSYHNTLNDDGSVASYNTSFTLKSLGEEELTKLIRSNMSTQEMEKAIQQAYRDNERKNKRKTNMFLANMLREKRTNDQQSASNSDAGSEE